MKFAPMKKTIYSLGALREALNAANRRYLEFLSAIDDPSNGIDKLNKITRTVHEEARGLIADSTSSTKTRRSALADTGPRRIHHQWRAEQSSTVHSVPAIQQRPNVEDHTLRLRTHGLLKKASHCYKYYLTALGKQGVVSAGPQTQRTCHHSRTCPRAYSLIPFS